MKINKQAAEAQQFTNAMIDGLKNGWGADDEWLQKIIKEHIIFLNDYGTNMDAKSFVNLGKFMVEDVFHRNMIEGQQVGLSYYLYTAAEMYAVKQ